MLGSYVCRQCRARLAKPTVPIKHPQWQSRATFLSFRPQTIEQNASSPEADAPTEARSDDAQIGSDKKLNRHLVESGDKFQPNERLGRYSRRTQDDVEDQYHSFAREESQWVDAENSTEVMKERQGPAVAISSALERRQLQRAWAMFQEHYTSKDCQALTEPSFGDVAWLANGKIFLRLLQAVNKGFCLNKNDPVVTPTQLLLQYEQLGIARPEFWGRQTLSFLTLQVMLSANGASREYARDLEPLLLELLSLWRAFFQAKGSQPVSPETLSANWNLPAISSLPDVFDSKPFQRRLQQFHPNYPFDFSISFCAVYLHTLSDAFRANETLQTASEPFLQVLSRLLAGSNVQAVVQRIDQFPKFDILPQEAQREIRHEISDAPHKALKEVGAGIQNADRGQEEGKDANLEDDYLKRMARAIKSRESINALEKLWQGALKDFRKDDQSLIPSRVYNSFLTGFMLLRRADRTVETWNHMIANGVKPDNRSWNALLDGCSKSKDLQAFNNIWSRLLSTSTEPDNYLWTARVHGLISMGQMREGLAALDDMGNRWRSAEQPEEPVHKLLRDGKAKNGVVSKSVNNCTKPTIEVINGAISAIVQRPVSSLSHQKRVDYIQKILAWSSNFDIKPDAITYNTLLNLYLRAGETGTAFKVLRQMERDGIAADVATYNMLLTAAFDNAAFAGLPKPEQTARVISHLNSLEQGGLKLTEHNYSTVIDRLLKEHSNHAAVADIMNHMAERNLVPTPHVYTSLMTYYFQLNPPAIPAVDALMNRVFTSHRIPTDVYLFDRALEGYGAHGEVGRMMSVLTRMSKHGRVPGWQAFTSIVRALVHDGDLHRAREVVRDVVRTEGMAKGGIMGGSAGEVNFFATVKALNVGIEVEGIGDHMLNEGFGSRVAGVPEQLHEQEADQISGLPSRSTKVISEGEPQAEPIEDIHDRFLAHGHEAKTTVSGRLN